MDSLSFYIVFHQKLFPENTPDYACFTYVAVNEAIPKEIDRGRLKHPILYEYDVHNYNPMYQMLKFRENSVILNMPAPLTPFIGFGQYDMRFVPEKFMSMIHHLKGYNTMVGFFPYRIEVIQDVLNADQWNEVLDVYNKHNTTAHRLQSLYDMPFFLMNTYILPSWFYLGLQSTLKSVLPTVIRFLQWNMKHIAGTLERVNSLIIACALKEGKLECLISDAIEDVREQTLTTANG
jgi:hypothetical protein